LRGALSRDRCTKSRSPARRAEGTLAVDLVTVFLLNGGLYPDLHRPEPVQIALLDPVQGPQISAAMTAEAMAAERAGVILHKLIAYIPTAGHTSGARWTRSRRPTCR
jgi:hypothetical protein